MGDLSLVVPNNVVITVVDIYDDEVKVVHKTEIDNIVNGLFELDFDALTSGETSDILDEINRMGTTIIMATHAKDIVDVMKKRVIEVQDGNIIRDEVGGEYLETVQN